MSYVLLFVSVTLALKVSSTQSPITLPELRGLHVEILQHPESDTVRIGEVAIFVCSAHADFINWLLNGRPLRYSDGYINQSTILQNKTTDIRLSTLYMRGLVTNNGSNITCLASLDGIAPASLSKNATLYVQGIISPTISSGSGIYLETTIMPAITINLLPSAHTSNIAPTGITNAQQESLIIAILAGIILIIVLLAVAISCAAGHQIVLKSTARRRQIHSLQVPAFYD